MTVEQTHTALDVWCQRRGDLRTRADGASGKFTVATLAAAEPLRPTGRTYTAGLVVQRMVSARALVAYDGNFYSVPSELARTAVTLARRLGAATSTSSPAARPATRWCSPATLTPAGAGALIRTGSHVTALNAAAMAASTPAFPHRRKQRIPPGPQAARPPSPLHPPRPPAPLSSSTCSAIPPPQPGGTVSHDQQQNAADPASQQRHLRLKSTAVIPQPPNQIDNRRCRTSRGGRLFNLTPPITGRQRVEWAFNGFKGRRTIAAATASRRRLAPRSRTSQPSSSGYAPHKSCTYLRRSMTMAMPWPPPTHMLSSPMVPPVERRPLSSVVMMRAPVMPNG